MRKEEALLDGRERKRRGRDESETLLFGRRRGGLCHSARRGALSVTVCDGAWGNTSAMRFLLRLDPRSHITDPRKQTIDDGVGKNDLLLNCGRCSPRHRAIHAPKSTSPLRHIRSNDCWGAANSKERREASPRSLCLGYRKEAN